MSYINRKINSEFKEKDKIEKNMSKDIDLAINMSIFEPLDEEVFEQMNMDYYKLQKIYNPVLNLDLSEKSEKIYKKIEEYYEKGNYKKIHKMAEKYDENYILQDEISTLRILKNKYEDFLNRIQKQIKKLKTSFPYNQKTILEDENLCRRKKDFLNKEIIKINSENKKIEKKIKNKLT